MKKLTLLKVTNVLVVVSFLTVAGSAMAINLFQASLYQLHQYAGYAFVLFAIIHIILNWTWIRINIFKKRN